ncbi:hypothetical protein D3C76_614960 [compost metagenome]|nr:hypothetical protein CBL13_02078 [Pseudomonas putida]
MPNTTQAIRGKSIFSQILNIEVLEENINNTDRNKELENTNYIISQCKGLNAKVICQHKNTKKHKLHQPTHNGWRTASIDCERGKPSACVLPSSNDFNGNNARISNKSDHAHHIA